MFCTHCGVKLDEHACYCSQCGSATLNAPQRPVGTGRMLTRSRDDVKVAGVCAGVARYLDVDVTLVRILWLALSICPPGGGIIAYIICMFVMPKDPLPMAMGATPASAPQR
jgi:phage shock protein C